ncbi:hypothetical protein M2092_002530, partial [Fusobacterium sp. PH5-44]
PRITYLTSDDIKSMYEYAPNKESDYFFFRDSKDDVKSFFENMLK